MDTVESLRVEIDFLKTTIKSLSSKIEITTACMVELNGLLVNIRDNVIYLAQEHENGR